MVGGTDGVTVGTAVGCVLTVGAGVGLDVVVGVGVGDREGVGVEVEFGGVCWSTCKVQSCTLETMTVR